MALFFIRSQTATSPLLGTVKDYRIFLNFINFYGSVMTFKIIFVYSI